MQDYIKKTLDINAQLPPFSVKQYDNDSRKLYISLVDRDNPTGEIVDLTNHTVRAYFQLPNDAVEYIDGVIEDESNGVFSVTFTNSVTARAGKVRCEIDITSSDDDSVISLKTFHFYVMTSIKDDEAIEATSEFTALTNALSAVYSLESQMDGLTAQAETAIANAETAVTSAETAISNVEAAITNAETAQSNLETATTTAEASRADLNTTVANASTAESELQTAIDNAGTAQTSLSSAIAEADTAAGDLTVLNTTSSELLADLQEQNEAATENISELTSANFDANEILTGVEDIKAYLGYIDEDIVGLQVDYANKSFQRLAGAYDLTAGDDFDAYEMYGGRMRCNVSDDGTIVAWYGDDDYAEDGSMGQVMVYQPKFYYKVVPLTYEKQSDGEGYHLRKANYYVSTKSKTGFKVHPAFIDADGNEVDYFLTGAYEGCLYDADGGEDGTGAIITDDSQVMNIAADMFCSVAGVKPASGLTQHLSRTYLETLAQNRGSNWHGDSIKLISAEQLLMMIEFASMNFQTAIANGVVSITSSSSYNCSSLTGSTAELGNGTGQATTTINEIDGTETEYTANGKTAICWRGKENFWGNIWKVACGVNIWGNGSMGGGQPYICNDFNFAESKNSDNYEAAGFTIANANGYISAMGYSTACDWLFMASECSGNSSLPVGDYHYVTSNLNGYRAARLGGSWSHNSNAGGFYWSLTDSVGYHNMGIGGRLVYVPNTTDESYSASVQAWEAQI